MQKPFFLALVLLLHSMMAGTALALSPHERFELRKTANGFLRLDKKTGIIALCSRDKLKWQCKNIDDDIKLYRQKIQKLGQIVPAQIKHRPAKPEEGRELDKVLSGFKEMLRRFKKLSRQMSLN